MLEYDYFDLLEYYEYHPLRLLSSDDIPTKEEIKTYVYAIETRYSNLKLAYEPLAEMLNEAWSVDLSEAFWDSDRIIKMHNINWTEDSVGMMLGKIMYMMREPSPGAQFNLTDISNFDLREYYMQDWFDVMDLQRCYEENPSDFAVNLYDYFDDNDIVLQKPVGIKILAEYNLYEKIRA